MPRCRWPSFTAALLLLYCCFTAALLLLYCCFFPAALLQLMACCFTTAYGMLLYYSLWHAGMPERAYYSL
jgi:hypothetical protein